MKNLLILVFGFILLQGCYYDKEELLYPSSVVDCSTINARFVDVKPVMQSKCAIASCHNSASAAGGVVLETYAQISGLKERILQRAIRDKTMPPASPLTATEIANITCWINSGALNN